MHPETGQIWKWLGEIPDPEIPVISLTDLGIIRDVHWDEDTLVVKVSPTYSGCPATAMINLDIASALKGRGVEKLRLERQLSPPWTTDWISAEGREKLRAFGIAPPGTVEAERIRKLAGEPPLPVTCPRCGSQDTEEVSRFGSTPCKAAWRCKACLEPFDRFKCI